MTTPQDPVASPSGEREPAPNEAAPSITVAIPTFNRCDRLRETVYALLTVGVSGVRATIFVVDDGSTDGTEQFMQELLATYAGPATLRYYRQPNQGPAAARNLALQHCETEWIAFLDDDCTPEPRWLSALFAMTRDGDATLAGIGGRFLPAKAHTLVAYYLELRGANEYPSPRRPFGTPLGGNCLFSREILQEIGGYDTTYRAAASEDSDLNRRLRQRGYQFRYQPAAVVHDHNVETLDALLSRAVQRGRSRVLKRALWRSPKRPTWVSALRELLLVLLWLGAILLAPLRAFPFLTARSRWPEATLLATIDALARAASRWGRLQMSVDVLLKRQSLERGTLLPPGEPHSLDPRDERADQLADAPSLPALP